MATSWEYARVYFANEVRKVKNGDPEWERLPVATVREAAEKEWKFCWWIEHRFEIWLPGSKDPEKRHSWSTGDDERATRWIDILNELGADGWELISLKIDSSAMGPTHGRETTSYPVRESATLKRPAA
jgi:hypothetical protein